MIPVVTAVNYIAKLLDARGGSEEYSHDEVFVFEILRALEAAYVEVVIEYSQNQRTWWCLLPAIRVREVVGTVVADVLLPIGVVLHPSNVEENNRGFFERTLIVPQYEAAATWRHQVTTVASRAITQRYARHRYTIRNGQLWIAVPGGSDYRVFVWYIPAPTFAMDGSSVINLASPAAWDVVHRAARLLATRDRQARRIGLQQTVQTLEQAQNLAVGAVVQSPELKGEV
jgi:hypothetical protein